MPRKKKTEQPRVETGKTVYHLLDMLAFVRTKSDAMTLFNKGQLKINGKKTSPNTLLSTFPKREFRVEAGSKSGDIYVPDW